MTYSNAKKVILSGVYNANDMSLMLDAFFLHKRISIDEYFELLDLMMDNPPK